MVKLNFCSSLFHSWQHFFKVAAISILVGILVGCPSTHAPQELSFDETKGSQYYLSQYSSASGDEKTNWQLLAIRSLIIENNLTKAKQFIGRLPLDLNQQQQKEKQFLQGEFAVKNQQNYDLSQLVFTELTDNQKIRYYKIKIGLAGQKRDVNAQIRDYIELEKLGSESQRHDTINDTWQFLTRLDDAAIRSVLVYANEPVLQGWIDLIYTYRNNSNTYVIEAEDDAETIAKKQEAQFDLIKNAISEWQMQYATHPAAVYLPRSIYGENYRLPDDTNAKSVALFLPLSGSSKIFGDTIYLGYGDAAKFYPQESQQNIYVYDTNSNSIEALVTQAKQKDVDLIVGPLLKQDVLTIMRLSPTTPVLALNKIESSEYPENLTTQICFFSLSPEDEAKDAAKHIFNQKKKSPLLIVPQNDLGKRVANSFMEQWSLTDSSLAGIYVQYFESEKSLSSQMNSGKGIELEGTLLSNRYPTQIQDSQAIVDSLINDDVMAPVGQVGDSSSQFDAIYIYASHEELTLIKSMLEMKSNKMTRDQKGNEVPIEKVIPTIYVSSRSNKANTTQDFRYDMERVQFSDIPLIIEQDPLVEALPDYIKNDYSLVRLYAMGVDAWQLANRFNRLEPYQIDILDGMTGKLSVAKQCEITRTLVWQQYRNGQEVAIK